METCRGVIEKKGLKIQYPYKIQGKKSSERVKMEVEEKTKTRLKSIRNLSDLRNIEIGDLAVVDLRQGEKPGEFGDLRMLVFDGVDECSFYWFIQKTTGRHKDNIIGFGKPRANIYFGSLEGTGVVRFAGSASRLHTRLYEPDSHGYEERKQRLINAGLW